MAANLLTNLRTRLFGLVHRGTSGRATGGFAVPREVARNVVARQWYRSPVLVGVWSVSMLAAMPGLGSSVADATLNDRARSALVLSSIQASSPSSRVMTTVESDVAPLVRMVRLENPGLQYTVGGAPAAIMWLHDGMGANLRDETPAEVDLSRLHALWLTTYAPAVSQRPMLRKADTSNASLSTSGVIAAPVALAPDTMAPLRSLLPVSRPEGLSRRAIQYSRDWLRRISLRTPSQDEACLATAIYHEARGETLKGQFAVAEVILNRVASRKFSNTICGVVFQGVKAGRYGGCQFSFACDRKSDDLRNRAAADLARRIAQVMADGGHRGLTSGALYFHTTAVNPSWARRFSQTTQIGAHLFYRG